VLLTIDGSRARSISPLGYRSRGSRSNRAVEPRFATVRSSDATAHASDGKIASTGVVRWGMDIALSSTAVDADPRRRAALTLSLAIAAGAATQALFWRTGLGLNFWIWDVCSVAGSVLAFQRGAIPRAAWGAIVAASLLGFFVVRYESSWTLVIAVPSTLALLAALPLLLARRSSLDELSRVPADLLASLVRTPRAIVIAARLPGVAGEGAPPGLVRGLTRGLLLGLPTAALFTLLLATDADFARSLVRVREELGDAVLFCGWSALTAIGYLVTHTLHGNRDAEARVDATLGPYRRHGESAAASVVRRRLGVSVITWAMVVGQVTLVFGLFVAANLRHLFGGHALVRAPGSLTYATYLHAGFYEVLFATVLSVCLVVIGHTLLERNAPEARSPVPGGLLLASLEGALLVLTGITVASCWQRLGIYEDAYGASHLRLGVAFIEVAILGVVLLTFGKVVARGWTGHAGAVLGFAVVMSVVASGFNADAYVGKTNLDRARAGKALDVEYLASLSADARGVFTHPYVLADPGLAARLEARYCTVRTASWRSFRGMGRCTR
jgi:hypothetical protein